MSKINGLLWANLPFLELIVELPHQHLLVQTPKTVINLHVTWLIIESSDPPSSKLRLGHVLNSESGLLLLLAAAGSIGRHMLLLRLTFEIHTTRGTGTRGRTLGTGRMGGTTTCRKSIE